MAFAVSPDLRTLFFPTRSGTRKFTNLHGTPRVALLVDNRANTEADYRSAAALTVMGAVSLQGGRAGDEGRRLLAARHASLAGFLSEPDCCIAAVTVTEYRLVTQFERVAVLDPQRMGLHP